MKKFLPILLIVLIIAGMCIPVSAAVMNYEQGSYLYDEDGILYGIPANTTYTALAANFSGTMNVKNAAGENITGSGYVGTGAVVSAGASSTVIVKGDVNGDGLLSSTDYLRIKRYVGEGDGIDGVFFKAADTDGNGKIQSFDYITIKRAFEGKTNLYSSLKITPYSSVFTHKTYNNMGNQRMDRNKITVGVFRIDGELWDDTHMSEFKNDFGGDYFMSYSAHGTGRSVSSLYKLCDKYGIGIFGRSLPRYTYPNTGKPNPVTDDPDYAEFDKKLEEYKYNNASVWAEDLYDEPRSTAFDWISGAITRYKAKFPDPANKFVYINLNPMNQQAGNVEGHGSATYTDYIKDFVNKVDTDYISFDIYPFDNNMTGMSKNYLYNLDVVASAARESGRNFWIIIQAGQNPVSSGDQLMPKASQIRYQVYTSLAYGAKSIAYACYSPCWWADGTSMINQDGTKNDYWYVGKQLNSEMKYLSPVFCQYDSTGVYGLSVTTSVTGRQIKTQTKRQSNRGYAESRAFNDIISDSDLLIGNFKKKDGSGYAMMLVDNTDPYDTTVSNTVSFKAISEGTVKCIQGGRTTTLTPDATGNYTVTLTSGDGAFITIE